MKTEAIARLGYYEAQSLEKWAENKKNACIAGQPRLNLIIMNQREGAFTPGGKSNAVWMLV
jgi:hypothetical protein